MHELAGANLDVPETGMLLNWLELLSGSTVTDVCGVISSSRDNHS